MILSQTHNKFPQDYSRLVMILMWNKNRIVTEWGNLAARAHKKAKAGRQFMKYTMFETDIKKANTHKRHLLLKVKETISTIEATCYKTKIK